MKNLLSNLRFYILLGSFWLAGMSAVIVYYLAGDSRVGTIRVQELFSFLSLIYLYVAMLITPLTKSFPVPLTSNLLFARRAIGVTAFFFGLSHAAFAVFGQFGGIGALSLLSAGYMFAFLLGIFGLFILFLMAITSFDIAIEKLSFLWWKRLHRLVYLAGLAILLHTYAIGSHFADITSIPSMLFLVAATFLAMLWAIGLDRHTTLRFGALGPYVLTLSIGIALFSSSLIVARLIEIDALTPPFGTHEEPRS